jgi:hypothetical protein
MQKEVLHKNNMAVFSYGDLAQGAGGFVGNMAKQAFTWVCEMYEKYPNSWLLSDFGKGLLDSTCPQMPVDLPQKFPPFAGGQCSFAYSVRGYLQVKRWSASLGCPGSEADGFSYLIAEAVAVGPIQGVSWRQEIPSSACSNIPESFSQAFMDVIDGSGNIISVATGRYQYKTTEPVDWFTTSGEVQGPTSTYFMPPFTPGGVFVQSFLPGQEDNCGDPEPIYPPDPPINSDDFTKNVNVNNNFGPDNPNNNNFNLTLNYSPMGPNFEFPININISGVNININVDEINVGGEGDSPNDIVSKDKLDKIDDTVTDIDNKIDNLPGNEEPIEEDNYDVGTPTEVETEEQVDDELIEWVRIDIITPPTHKMTILGNVPEDTVYFAGYFRWSYNDGYTSEGIPIRYSKTQFKKPGGATGYRLYAINNAKLKATIFKEKQST